MFHKVSTMNPKSRLLFCTHHNQFEMHKNAEKIFDHQNKCNGKKVSVTRKSKEENNPSIYIYIEISTYFIK